MYKVEKKYNYGELWQDGRLLFTFEYTDDANFVKSELEAKDAHIAKLEDELKQAKEAIYIYENPNKFDWESVPLQAYPAVRFLVSEHNLKLSEKDLVIAGLKTKVEQLKATLQPIADMWRDYVFETQNDAYEDNSFSYWFEDNVDIDTYYPLFEDTYKVLDKMSELSDNEIE